MLKVFLISIVFVGLSFIGIVIKMLLKKGGEFQKSCGSVDPTTGKRIACTCGKMDDERCNNKKRYEDIEFEEIKAH